MVYLLAPKLDRKLSPNVYSYRLHKNWKRRAKKGRSVFREGDDEIPFLKTRTIRRIDPIESWYTLWPEFEKQTARAVKEFGCTHLTKTDITAYFECIDLRILETQLRSLLRQDEDALFQVLFRVLDGWTRVTSTGTPVGRGIPQGNDVSRFLGNLYLLPLDRELDRFCKKHDALWCRYVDDVKVMTRSEKTAREAVFLVNDCLRSLHLNLQGSKTKILSGDELDAAIYDPDGERVSATIDAIQKLQPLTKEKAPSVTKELKKISYLLPRFRRNRGRDVRSLDGDESRLFRRCMTAYGLGRRPHLIDAAFEALRALPDLRILKKALGYVTLQPYQRHDEIIGRLLELIEGDALPFPYQVAVVVDHFRHLHPSNPREVGSRLRPFAIGSTRFWYVRQKAAEAIMTFPYREDSACRLCKSLLKSEHPWVRRAGFLMLIRSEIEYVRNQIRQLIYDADQSISRLALYFERHIHERAFADRRLSDLARNNPDDRRFILSLPSLYAIRCSPDMYLVQRLHEIAAKFAGSRSAKVRWHAAKLRDSTS